MDRRAQYGRASHVHQTLGLVNVTEKLKATVLIAKLKQHYMWCFLVFIDLYVVRWHYVISHVSSSMVADKPGRTAPFGLRGWRRVAVTRFKSAEALSSLDVKVSNCWRHRSSRV